MTTLSPLHISSGEQYEQGYNLFVKDGEAYIFDEFAIVSYFLRKGDILPRDIDELKRKIETHLDKLIEANIYIRKIKTNFKNLNKPLFEQISTQSKPMVSGSSIKGAIETAIFDLFVKDSARVQRIKTVLKNKNFPKRRFDDGRRAKHTIDSDFMKIFRNLKIADSTDTLDTRIYKTINVKKKKEEQKYREEKVEKISNFVEAIEPNQSFIIEIKDTSEEKIFQDIGSICNEYYIPKLKEDIGYYFYKNGSLAVTNLTGLNNKKFLLNLGRFGGAEKKSIDEYRYIPKFHAEDKSTTSAITFALEAPCEDRVFFENCLMPFGWVLCEVEE